MEQVMYMTSVFLSMLLYVLLAAMTARAVVGWFIQEPTAFTDFLYLVTEPVILPVRYLCESFGWFEGVPIDMPFFITTVLLSIAGVALKALA